MKHSQKITIIGAGKVGQSLHQLMSNNGVNVQLIGRDLKQQQKACRASDVVLLTVSDAAIEDICEQLTGYFNSGAVVAHCSGALSSDILSSAQRNGCFTASLHPLNTFPSLEASLSLFSNTAHGTYLYAEGDTDALSLTLPLFQHLGFKSIELQAQAKTAYHAACVFACNYLTVLMDLSLKVAGSAGLDQKQFWSAAQPLIQSTLNNINQHGTAMSLSGPVARGDAVTVKQHIEQLQKSTDKIFDKSTMLDAYLALGRHALDMTERQDKLPNEKVRQLELLLT